MPKSRSVPARAATSARKTAQVDASSSDASPANGGSLRERADVLFRAALECCRQRERYARVVTWDVEPGEQKAVSRVVGLCDQHLRAALDGYERAVGSQNGSAPNDEWSRAANALWQAGREWVRRHASAEESSRRLTRHTREKLGELTVEYDLEASALLALQQALGNYRKVSPQADLNGRR